ncbi:MAG: GntR family transcriptional regulator [Naasia sp.]|jgi:GntR family transcriptional regulator|uniref:GntR family transcriptional regulator n=1 Tax=Naasia sp. TaxID=2546198 RepID=UPI00260F3EAA|nr:GntR family transcriptional regulator [Naasia sp.]MCU1570051.1 GntR family transcriptional regulator [Naasia sp.]
MTTAGGTTRAQAIEDWLREKVHAGKEGDPLPSETELATRFGVSRMTARHAVQNLASEGLVSRRPGAGTFIAATPMHRHFGPLMSFTADMKRRGLMASSQLISAELREPTGSESTALGLAPGLRLVAIIRLRLANGSPMAIEHTRLTPDCLPLLGGDLEKGSLHEALRTFGREPTLALCRISARAATAKEAKLLGLAPRSAVLTEERVISDQESKELEFTTTVYAPERYVIDAVFSLSGTQEG